MFKHLEAPDFDACLRVFVESDARTLASVRALTHATEEKAYVVASKRVHKLWRLIGVERAIEEVARTGQRGEEVRRVLEVCGSLRAKGKKK